MTSATQDVTAPPTGLRLWWQTARPATLVLSLMPVVVATALARAAGVADLWAALAAATGAAAIQIGTNLFNDYEDCRRGADTDARVGPARASQRGWLRPAQVLGATLLAFAVAVAAGLYLVAIAGWPVVAIGVASILSGLAYTGGPRPLAYVGLGDLFVFLFFGLVAVCGAYFVQAHTLSAAVGVAASALGLLSTAVLVVNNLRDRHTDALAGKRTLAVRWGARVARWEYTLLLAGAYLLPLTAWLTGIAGAAWLATGLSLPLAAAQIRGVWRREGAELNGHLAGTARLTLIYSLLLAGGVAL